MVAQTTGGVLPLMHTHDIKFFVMPIQPYKLKGEGKVPHITQESEAFGLLTIKNAYKKWEAVIPKKIEDSDWVVPKYDKDDVSTHRYHDTLWSDGRNGQVKGGG